MILKHPFIDWILTLLGAFVLARIFKYDFVVVFIILIFLSIPLHIIMETPTNTNFYLGLSTSPR